MAREHDPESEPVSAQEVAYDDLLRRIAEVPWTESRFLTEAEVASSLGISHTPVREAMQILEASGHLTIYPRKGAFVPPLTERTVDELFDARIVVETFCARRAVELNNLDFPAMKEQIARQEDNPYEAPVFLSSDIRFHQEIVKSAVHHLFKRFYSDLRELQARASIGLLSSDKAQAPRVIEEHSGIYEALKSGNGEEAERQIVSHIESARAAVHSTIGR